MNPIVTSNTTTLKEQPAQAESERSPAKTPFQIAIEAPLQHILAKAHTHNPYVAGAIAGACETTLFYPTVIWGLSRQLNKPLPPYLSGYYKGFGFNLATMVPTFSIMMGVNGYLKKKFSDENGLSTLAKVGIAGVSAVSATTFMNPMEVVTVQLRLNPNLSASKVVRQVVEEHGITALYKGVGPATGRNFIYFLGIAVGTEQMKSVLPDFCKNSNGNVSDTTTTVVAGVAGLFSGVLSHPFHVVNANAKKTFKQESFLKTLIDMRNNGGNSALFPGLFPRLVRIAGGSSVVVLAMNMLMRDKKT